MIKRLEIAGVHMDVGADLRKHVEQKIGRLDRYASRHTRESMHAEVKLKEGKAKGKSERTCEVILHLPQETFRLKETAANIFAAVDIVEEKLKTHLKKYKELHTNPKFYRRLVAKFKPGM